MGTRAAAFTAKIRNLSEYNNRLMQGTLPSPTGSDIASTLKYFNQLLLGVLKDMKASPITMLRHRSQDEARQNLLPSLDYQGLYKTITNLMDLLNFVVIGKHAVGTGILQILSTLIIFLDRETVNTVPFLLASMIANTPETVHPYLLKTMCFHILPSSVGVSPRGSEDDDYSQSSVPAVIMLILQYTSSPSYHCQLIESLMAVKHDLIQDLISVIAYGTPGSRIPAANLLFYYWPNLNPTLFDRRGVHIKFSDISSVLKAMFNKPAQGVKTDSVSHTGANSEPGESKTPKGWKALPCQNDNCQATDNKQMVKVCLDHVAALGACPESAPPLYLCSHCVDELKGTQSNVEFEDILSPMITVSTSCENKSCRSSEKNALFTCFDLECCSYNNNRPIRYCAQCNTIKHESKRGSDHKVHTAITSVWDQEPQVMHYIIECIVSLLGEAQPIADKIKNKDNDRANRAPVMEENDQVSTCSLEEGRVLSRFGVWLVVGLCTPNENTNLPILGRLLGAVCHWFTATHYIPDDQQGATIERLKSDHLQGWLQEVCKTHLDIFVDCLLPHPSEYCRVGGHWETLSPRTEHVEEGFRRLFCMVPYEVVTANVWERVMPHWLEAINRDVTEDHLVTLKITLSKLLDSEMSPLGFDTNQMYHFLGVRFENTPVNVQEQNLQWLQMLSSLSIVIPIYHLISMFETGVESVLCPEKSVNKSCSSPDRNDGDGIDEEDDSPEIERVVGSGDGSSSGLSEDENEDNEENRKDDSKSSSKSELILSCFVLMLDIVYKQMEVQDIVKHQGINSGISTAMWQLFNKMLSTPCLISHPCSDECNMCYLTNTFFQLSTEILIHLCPKLPIMNNRVADMLPSEVDSSSEKKTSESAHASETSKMAQSSSATASSGLPTVTPTGITFMSAMAVMPQIVTATVDTVGDLDLVANIPQEQVMEAVASATTCTEEDLAHATASIATASVVGANDEPIDTTLPFEEEEDVWVTTQGKFRFKLEDLPPHLQVIYALLERLTNTTDGDEVYHICLCLKFLVLHGEALAQSASNHKGLLIWLQENVNINIMWTLICGEWSHVAEICVALLLHFITLPQGADIFWKLCENYFNHQDWQVRFQSTEKVVVLGRFLNIQSVRQCPGLQGAVAHAFCFLVASLDDLNVAVAQRASLGLSSLPDSGLRALCWCLEQQFDSVILDRPMIIQTLHQLCSSLPDRRILTWDFFYNRFDALYIESQIALEKHGKIISFPPRDLRNSDMSSDIFARKLSRAQDALSLVQNSCVKTLSSSLGPKCPYKRTMSAPANMLNKIDKPVMTVFEPVVKQREKSYSRQYSVPILKQRSSKTGLAAVEGGANVGGGLGFGGGGNTALKVLEDSSMMQQLQRAMDMDEMDKDTLHLLTFLFMQFLSKPQHAGGSDEKGGGKTTETVLRHIAALMGYSVVESNFPIAPVKLRSSPVFNSFIANLPHVLDHNFEMAKKVIAIIIPVLQYCPASHRISDLRNPPYSLWALQPIVRKSWLSSVLTIFYKFDCEEDSYLKSQVSSIILITMNTLDRHFHRCPKDHATALASSSLHYSREMSQGSIGGEGETDGGGGPERSSPATAVDATGAGKITLTPATPTIPEVQQSGPVPIHPQSGYPISPAAAASAAPVASTSTGEFGLSGGRNIGGISDIDEDNEKEIWYEASSLDPTRVLPPPEIFANASSVEDNSSSSERAVSVMKADSQHSEPAKAVTSVMASQILAFDDSFTVKIHNTEFADGDDSGLQRLSEKALEGLRSRFAFSHLDVQATSHQSLSASNTDTSNSPLSCHENIAAVAAAMKNDNKEVAIIRKVTPAISSSTPKSSGSSQRSSASYWISSSTSTDSSSDFNISRAPTKLAFEICYEEDAETWSVSETSDDTKNNNEKVIRSQEIDKTSEIAKSLTSVAPTINFAKACVVTPEIIQERCVQKRDDFNNNGRKIVQHQVCHAISDQIVEENLETVVMEPTYNKPSSPHTLGDQSKTELMICSPPSPLSMMDIVTVGPPVRIDCQARKAHHSDVPSPKKPEIPTPERLLDGATSSGDELSEDQKSIITRVWQVFGGGAWSDEEQKEETHENSLATAKMVVEKQRTTSSVVQASQHISYNPPIVKSISAERKMQGQREIEKTATVVNESLLSRANQQSSRDMMLQRQSAISTSAVTPEKKTSETKGTGVSKSNDCPAVGEKTRTKSSETAGGKSNDSVEGAISDREDMKSIDTGSSDGPPPSSMKQSDLRVGEECMLHRCLECGEALEEFSNDDLGMCIIILSTFVHRKPAMAAQHLPRMLHIVARVAGSEIFSWQYDSNVHLPGSATTVGAQFLRCVLHQLTPNQIFYQIFTTNIEQKYRIKLFKTLANVLLDFNELNNSIPVQRLLENLNERKELPSDCMDIILGNVSCYMECVYENTNTSFVAALFPLFETFLRKLYLCFNIVEDVNPLFRLLVTFFKIPTVGSHKNILDPVSKIVVFSLRKSAVKYNLVVELCLLCSRSFQKERLFLARSMALELVSALKFKVILPDTNLVLLVQLILQDNGGTLGPNPILEEITDSSCVDPGGPHNSTMLAECVRASNLNDIIDFIADVHTLTKIKSGLNQDTIGGLVKAGLSQYLALEISRGSSRDTRFFNKFLPWLNNPPTTVQQGPKEFLECVSHIRLLSWLLLGSLMHNCHQSNPVGTANCMPIPPDASCHIADHIQVILSGFPEQSKASVVNMSSLFLAFILSQVWTLYLEQNASSPGTDQYNTTCALLIDFWAKVTHSILTLIKHSKVYVSQLGEMVSLHFLSLLEALQECGSTILTRLLPLWAPLLHSPYQTKLPDQLAVRLQACQDAIPLHTPGCIGANSTSPLPPLHTTPLSSSTMLPNLLNWLNRLQFKMGQIELQSSAATQIYSL